MIIGQHSVNPKRIITASYSPAQGTYNLFKISYRIGGEIVDLSQLGTEQDCKKWLRQVDKVIKYQIMNDISEREESENAIGSPIGFAPQGEYEDE